MVNPGAFRGSRKDFLTSCKAEYSEGVRNGCSGDVLANIQRRYFKRYPVFLDHDSEPPSDWLDTVDDDAPDPEVVLPDRNALGSDEAYRAAMKALEEHQELIRFRKGQIKRWLAYQYMRDNSLPARESGAYNPYRTFVNKLGGISEKKPHARSKINTWRRSDPQINDNINAEATRRIQAQTDAGQKFMPKNLATLRDKIAHEMFRSLSLAEQDKWAERAKEEHEEAVKEWERERNEPPSTSPADRQRAINGVVQVMQPALNALYDATGWCWTLIGAGPEPADEGRLNMISIHAGKTSGPVPMNFGRFHQERYKTELVPLFRDFVQNCFTVDECRARALPHHEGHLGLAALDIANEDGSNAVVVHHIPRISRPVAPPSASAQDSLMDVLMRLSAPATQQRHEPLPAPAQPPPSTSPSEPSELPPADAQSANNARVRSPASALASPALLASTPTPAPIASNVTRVTPSPMHTVTPVEIIEPVPAQENGGCGSGAEEDIVRDGDGGSGNLGCGDVEVEGGTAQLSGHTVEGATLHSSAAGEMAGGNSANQTSGDVSDEVHEHEGPPPDHSIQDPTINSPHTTANLKRKRGRPSKATVAERSLLTAGSAEPLHRVTRSQAHAVGITQPQGRRTRSARGTAPLVQLEDPEPRRKQRRTLPGDVQDPAPDTTPDAATGKRPSTDEHRDRIEAFNRAYPNAPEWFAKSANMFLSLDLGATWHKVVSEWAEFEKRHDFCERERIKMNGRPGAVGDWVCRERNEDWRPEIENLLAYEEAYSQWWMVLQPSWRVENSQVMFDMTDGSWEILRKPGANGIVGALAALFFWGHHLVTESDTYRDLWTTYVDDFQMVLPQLRC